MFSRVNPFGWGFADPFDPGQANQMDINLANAADMAGGGTYAPASQFVVGGAGFKATTFLDVGAGAFLQMGNGSSFDYDSGKLTITPFGFLTNVGFVSLFQGAVTLAPTATLVVNSGATFGAAAVFSLGLAANAASLFTANVTFNSTTTFAGTATFNGALNTNAMLTAAAGFHLSGGTGTFDTTTNFLGALRLPGPNSIELTGPATVQWRPMVTAGLDANVTISADDGDHFRPPAITANRIWTVANAAAGKRIKISLILTTGVNTVELRRGDASTITTMQNAAGKPGSAELLYTAGLGWVLFDSNEGPLVP